MKKLPFIVVLAVCSLGCWFLTHAADESAPQPLRVLLIAGGCCHDYETQKMILKEGIETRLNAEVVVDHNPDRSTKAIFPSYENEDWAEGYDVILHDECSANVTGPAYINRILDAHKNGTPAVNLHCAMHSYRWGDFREPVAAGADNAGWFEMLGIQSTGHGPKSPVDISFTDTDHPITKGMADWTTVDEELYNNVQVFASAHALASGRQLQKPRKKKGKPSDPKAEPKEANAVVIWTNHYGPGKTRIFSTTLGHFNETVSDPRYLDLVARGLLWVTGKLADDGTPESGYAKREPTVADFDSDSFNDSSRHRQAVVASSLEGDL